MKAEPAEKLSTAIQVGDIVLLAEGRRLPYIRAYGPELADKKWTVTYIDMVYGRKRLYVGDETPSVIFASDARLAYTPQSKARREQLKKAGRR